MNRKSHPRRILNDKIQWNQPLGDGNRRHGQDYPLLEGLAGHEIGRRIGATRLQALLFEISENDLIAFFEWPGVETVPHKDHGRPVTGPFIFDHVSFGVEAEEDLWELKDKLTAAEFRVSDVIDHGFIHSIYAFDPNGIPIEFSHNVEDVDVRQNPQMADSAPSAVTREGSEPNFDKWPRAERKVYPGAGSELFHGIREAG